MHLAKRDVTAQANAALEADNNYLINTARTLKIAIRYAIDNEHKPLREGGTSFLTDWLASDDPEKFAADHPDWVEYRDAAIAEIVASIKAQQQTDKALN